MKCEQVQEQLTQYLLGDLDAQRCADIQGHLEECDGCRAATREIEPTLDLLRNALAASSQVSDRLSKDARVRVLVAGKPAVLRFDWWLVRRHQWLAAAAAALFMCGFIWLAINSMTMKARVPSDRTVAVVLHDQAELQSLDFIEELKEEPIPSPGEVPMRDAEDLVGGVADENLFLGVAAESTPATPPAPQSATPSAALDSTVMTKSPVIMRGLYRSRTSGTRGRAISSYGGGLGGAAGGEERAPADESDEVADLDMVGERQVAAAGEPMRTAARETALGVKAVEYERAAQTYDVSEAPGQDKAETTLRGLKLRVDRLGIQNGVTEFKRTSEQAKYRTPDVEKQAESSLRRNIQADQEIKPSAWAYEVPAATRPEPESLRKHMRMSTATVQTEGAGPGHGTVPPQEGEHKPAGYETRDRRLAINLNEITVAAGPAISGTEDLSVVQPQKEQDSSKREDDRDARRKDAAGKKAADKGIEVDLESVKEALVESRAKAEPEVAPSFKATGVNPFVSAGEKPFSTFAIDVDTASYTLARNYMNGGDRPPAESVRTEEFVNFFDYDYRPPERDVFAVHTEIAPSRFGRGLHLLKIGVKGLRLGREEQRPAVLTFLVDTSGSMDKPDRIGLIKKSLRFLVDELGPRDRVAIVQYGSEARLVLDHTVASEKQKILAAIDALQCGGSTNLEKGMRRAYEFAARAFTGGGENRVLLLSDGVANLGTSSADDILKDIERFRHQGITCSVFGFGMGTYNDVMLETLANKGDGTYTFIDSEEEARRIFVDDLAATLNTIAADVKIQVEFKPEAIKRYRQLGYENRQLQKEDFRNDAVDAGEVGSGQSVTALYELELNPRRLQAAQSLRSVRRVLATVRVRYRRTDTGAVEEIEREITEADLISAFDRAPVRFRLAACVAEFAEILRGSPFATGSELREVADVLRPVALDLTLDTRVGELMRMVEMMKGQGE